MAAIAPFALAACQTTTSDEWTGDGSTDFTQAERSCEKQTENIEEKAERAEFFVGCMRALGWEPKPGTEYATPEDAPDPT